MPGWLDELVLRSDGPPWLAMGLARIDDAQWLVPDERRADELALRRELLDRRHVDVFAALAGTEAAGAEVRELVRDWLARFRPDLAAVAPAALADHGDRPHHPLEEAGRLVQEDLALMVPHGERFHLDAACLCFPSHWRLADKVGGSAASIHGPVPGYDDELAARVDRYLARLRPGTISARRNWSVHDAPDLHAPVRPPPRSLGVDDVAEGLWLRSERQTLRRLPASGAVLFTIRVQQAPLAVLTEDPVVARRFLDRIVAQPPALTAMNGLAPHRDAVVAWLRAALR